MAQQNWVVTGAAGFLGSHIVEQLLNGGQDVTAVDDLSWGKEEHLNGFEENPNFHFYKADIREARGLRSIFQKSKPDHIIHLAALHFIPLAMKQPTLTADINVTGTQSILEATRDTDAQSFFFASSGDVYGNSEEDLDEKTSALEPFNVHGLTKLMGEKLIEIESKIQSERSFINARLFNLIGPRETNPHIIPTIIGQLKSDKTKLKLGKTWPIRDYVPVDQASKAAIELCLQADQGVTTCNLATGTGQSVDDLLELIKELLGHDIQIIEDEDRVRSQDRKKLVAKVDHLKSIIGWTPTHKVKEILNMLLLSEGIL